MIEELADQYPGDQARGGHATVDHCRRNRRGGDAFARTAGVLRTNVPVHEELGRRNVKLLANVFADLDQLAAALAAAAGLGFVAVFDARQMLRQGLATGTLDQLNRLAREITEERRTREGVPSSRE